MTLLIERLGMVYQYTKMLVHSTMRGPR